METRSHRLKALLADRQRRFRHRRRNGLRVTAVEYDGLILNFLLDPRVRWLTEADADSSKKVGEAIFKNLRLLAEHHFGMK
jgi:hypothetical protein